MITKRYKVYRYSKAHGFLCLFLFSGGAPQFSTETNGRIAPVTPVRKSSMISSPATRTPTNQTAVVSPLTSSLNNSLNNILNCSPPDYLQKNNVTKSNSSIISSGNNNLADPNKSHSISTGNVSDTKVKSSSSNDNVNSGSAHKIYGSSLLCYQNVPPPSPTNSVANDNTKNTSTSSQKTSDESKTPKGSNSSSATTLAALLPGDSTTLPVKKRSKLRHRLSDVGSWGLRRKDRAHKYRSMNIESLEVLGDPVIEDTFFVSSFLLNSFVSNKSNVFNEHSVSESGRLFQQNSNHKISTYS